MKLRNVLLAVVVISAASVGQAQVRLANIFNDNMVLQQGKPLRIWGWAAPGSNVTVTITESRDEALAGPPEKTHLALRMRRTAHSGPAFASRVGKFRS
jgi:sialate O-acetylesterase